MLLKDFLLLKKISPDDFSKSIGSGLATVYRWMNGTRRPSNNFIIKIHNETGGLVTANDFYSAPEKKEKEVQQ